MVAWANSVDPGMRRFGFNPFGRDVADEIHTDLLRLAAAGKIRPAVGRRVSMEEAGRALDEHAAAGDRWAARWWWCNDGEPMSTVEYTWRDSELRSPPLRALNWTGAQLARFGPELPSLSPSSVTTAAIKLAGSDDFGSDSYREPLEVYLRACEDEAELTTFGRLLVSKMLARALANRIALQDWSNKHPEVREGRIERPWIIVGLPRTGTSLLSILLGLDPVARPLLQWEAAHPVPPADPGGSGGGPACRPDGERPRRAHEAQPAAQGHAPLWRHRGRGMRGDLHV